MIKSHEIKNVTDFNVADSVRRDIKVLVTKTRYTVVKQNRKTSNSTYTLYRKRGKIRWAKHSWFQPYEVFHGSTFAVHWLPVFITFLKLKIHGKTIAVSSITTKTMKL